jgi:hypothetical protein
MRFGKVAAFSGKALQRVGELHLLAAMHFERVVMALRHPAVMVLSKTSFKVIAPFSDHRLEQSVLFAPIELSDNYARSQRAGQRLRDTRTAQFCANPQDADLQRMQLTRRFLRFRAEVEQSHEMR